VDGIVWFQTLKGWEPYFNQEVNTISMLLGDGERAPKPAFSLTTFVHCHDRFASKVRSLVSIKE